ncbi:hypothetical protein CHU00_12230 [Sphingobacterium cellulitidis]|uniref:YaiO family outer membrane beta-barrel protein n=1 Tax=Sphingobacterium cellulitidis TaxID=1768011 RepID=UPI000B9443F6|nr:YaiO family outer membrane beta-barrel protein [Sphingobacterium cellulitidis]OYD45405.1 hypothetical protein CHU00_12230 [Sphingobacterium cellulitidis]
MNLRTQLLIILVFFLGFGSLNVQAQDSNLNSDELFQRARIEAFDNKDYPKAVNLAKVALAKSPDYTDISIFLGRLYTWMDKIDSARIVFNQLDVKDVKDPDFYFAYGSLEYWEDNYPQALTIVNKGLLKDPKSMDLLLLKSKIANASKDYKSAKTTLDEILEIDPKNADARTLQIAIKEQVASNEVGINYNWMYFDKQFDDNWHILGLSYKRGTPIGSFIFRANLANKFGSNGTQFELEAYPRLSKMFYMYLGTGFSNSEGLFPKFRTAASLYANLPASFEAEVGFRQLKFTDNVWMYTASIGKYYKNFWFNARTYLTPGENNISQSYAGTVRYYTKGSDDYLGFIVGTGISPDQNRENLLFDNEYKLKTFKSGVDYNFSLKSKNIFNISATYYNVEYKPKTRDNQVDVSLGYRRRF